MCKSTLAQQPTDSTVCVEIDTDIHSRVFPWELGTTGMEGKPVKGGGSIKEFSVQQWNMI